MLKLPKICSLWRSLVIFPLFCDRVPEDSSFWPPKKNLHFPTKKDHFWVGLGATRCLKAETAKMGSLWRFCCFFYYFAWKSSNFILVTDKNWLFSAKIDHIGKEWMQLDGSRLKLRNTCSFWRFLVIFPLLCYRFIKVSSFWSHTRICTFRQKVIIFR